MVELQENTTYAIGELPAWQPQKRHSLFEFVLYALMTSFLVIALPKTGASYLLARAVQGIEVLAFIYLFARKFVQPKTKADSLHILTHLFWIAYVVLAFSLSVTKSLTPIFLYLQVFIFLLLLDNYWKQDLVGSMRMLAVILSLLVYLNTILYILYPDGLWIDTSMESLGDNRRYLFGNYNATGSITLLALLAQGIYTISTSRGKLNMYLLCAVGIWTCWDMGSMTSVVGLSILTLYFVFRKLIRHPFVWIIGFFVFYTAFFAFVVWGGNSIEQVPIATRFIEDVLQKNTTFSTRTELWYNSVQLILDRPWIGYGPQDTHWMVVHVGNSSSHNLWLHILVEGGLLLFIPFSGLFIGAFLTAYRAKNTAAQFAAVTLAVLILMSLFEAYNRVIIFMLFISVYSTQHIEKTD